MFFSLVLRLPAYRGVLRQRITAEQQDASSSGYQATPAARPARNPVRYEAASPMRNNARTATSAPPATRASLTELNTRLGATWFSHRTVPGGGTA